MGSRRPFVNESAFLSTFYGSSGGLKKKIEVKNRILHLHFREVTGLNDLKDFAEKFDGQWIVAFELYSHPNMYTREKPKFTELSRTLFGLSNI